MVLVAEPPVTSPRTLAEAYGLLDDGGPRWRPIAGGTDLMVQLAAGPGSAPAGAGSTPARVLDLWGLDELRGIAIDGDELVLGALATYTEIRRSKLCHEVMPALAEAAATIGATQIQNRGTIGGNVVNASPAGDTLPVLLATGARFDVGGPRGERTVSVDTFWPAYRRTALASDELLLRVRIPIVPDREVRFRKIGTRRAQAISKVVMALAWRDADGRWTDVRLALGSVAPTPIRAARTEAALEGREPGPEVAALAAETLAGELSPIDDVRSTADYRRMVAARVLHRIIRDAGGW